MATTADRVSTSSASSAGSAGTTGLRRDVGKIALMFTSVGSVIGSGWLLGALNATQIAGPAIISWVVGAIAIMLLALVAAYQGPRSTLSDSTNRIGIGRQWLAARHPCRALDLRLLPSRPAASRPGFQVRRNQAWIQAR